MAGETPQPDASEQQFQWGCLIPGGVVTAFAVVWGLLLDATAGPNPDPEQVDGDRWATGCYVFLGLGLFIAGFLFGWKDMKRQSRRGFEVVQSPEVQSKQEHTE